MYKGKILNKNNTDRKIKAFPIGYDNQFYCNVLDIEKRLYIEIDLFNEHKDFNRLFHNFSFIHPFIDGDGRTYNQNCSIDVVLLLLSYVCYLESSSRKCIVIK